MKNMVLLIDSNVIMDVILNREPFFEKSYRITEMCKNEEVDAYLAAHTITNAYYSLRKHFSIDERRDIIIALFTVYQIVSIDSEKLLNALNNREFKDFEDCLQVECAKSIKADYIITRDAKDFANSEITFLTPEEFCSKFEKNSNDNI